MRRAAPLLLLLYLTGAAVNADDSAFTIPLYGEKLKGFVTVENVADDQYVLSFKMDEMPDDTRLSLHMSSAPYDSGVMPENCRRARKTPHIFRNQPIEDTTVQGSQLSGHTLILGTPESIYACTTVILGSQPLMAASFHEDPIQGPIHIIRLKDKVRILPDLKYIPHYEGTIGVEFIDWAFVESCENAQNSNQNAVGMELGVDSRATLTIETGVNISLFNFQIFRNGKPFACSPIVNVERRSIKAAGLKLVQPHYYVAARNVGDKMDQLKIREDCLDVATETPHSPFHDYFPTVSIFGPDTIMFKSVVLNTTCHALRPTFPLPSAMVNFFHPTVGRLVLVDTDDRIILTGNLRSLTDKDAARATVQISPKPAPSEECPLYLDDCTDCFTVPDAAIIVGKDDDAVSLIGVLPYFKLSEMRSVIVDLQWTEEPFRVCANLTYLPGGALQVSLAARRYTPVSSKTMATVVVLEYPANEYSEVVVNKRAEISAVEAHARPVDMAVTSGPPCGDQNIGSKARAPQWLQIIDAVIKHGKNTSTYVVDDMLISGANSLLGTSLLLSHESDYYCGTFRFPQETNRLVAKIDGELTGYVQMSQYAMTGDIPTEVSYSITRPNSTETEFLQWEIVSVTNETCEEAEVFNPFKVESTVCSDEKPSQCAIGDLSTKAGDITTGRKQHLSVINLPVSGVRSVRDKMVRLSSTTTNETIGCYRLLLMEDATFTWMVYSNQSLIALQSLMAQRLHLEHFQIALEYNRELVGGRCSSYRVTVLESNERLADILFIFDVENKKFREDAELICGKQEELTSSTTTTVGPTTTTASSKAYLTPSDTSTSTSGATTKSSTTTSQQPVKSSRSSSIALGILLCALYW
ncbi:hypothetical protein PENTCL1PPCAC_30036 [Pristionchus entomophagus]|uniref:Uncharacterized protein n=1 Tax=Pristionchus entomophagus TaxID=358040 RepID=A0AAV5UMQ5_9BILA|nr:hypothetical protein PENTCL1PPCAC_30036 [Pristionchus entomophagus]